MFQEVIITSAPRGIKPGKTGFQAVACSQGTRGDVIATAERLASYRHIYPQGSGKNPPIYAHRILNTSLGPTHFLVRTIDAGNDYTGRSNKLSHILFSDDRSIGAYRASSPAAVLSANGSRLLDQWAGDVGYRSRSVELANPPAQAAKCVSWHQATGDAAWAAVIASRAAKGLKSYLVAPEASPETSALLLRLFAEAVNLLPASQRWSVAFDTVYLGSGDCALLGTYRGSPELQTQDPNAVYVDLAAPPPPPLQGVAEDLIATARQGQAAVASRTRATGVQKRTRGAPPPRPGEDRGRPAVGPRAQVKTQTSHAAVGARKRGHDTQDDSITKFIVAAVMLFAILLVGGGVTVAIQLAGRTNVEEGGNGAIPVPDSLAKLEAKKVAEHVDEKVVRLARGSDAGDHVVKVGLSKEKLTRLTPTFGKVGLSLTEGEYDFKCAAGEITLDYSRAAAGPPNYVFVSIDEQEPIQIWCTQDAFQAHQVAEQTKQTEQDLKNLTTAGERAIGISAQQGKLVDNKTLIKLARDDSNLFLHLVNEDTKQLLTLVELQEPSENGQTHEIQRTSDGSQLVVFNVVKQNERERLLNVHDGRQAPHDSPSDHLEVKNALREARLAITYTAPSPTSGAQPVSETVEVWFSDEGRQAFTKRAEAEEQRQAADKARKELETKQTQAREKDQAAFSSLIQQVDEKTPVDVADGKLPTKITLASGVPDLQGLSMAFSCNPESGLSWKPAENADGTWELSAEAQPVARAAVGNDGLAIVIEPNLSPQDQARVAFARMTLSLKPNPSTWGDNPVSVTPASFRIASPLQLNWHGIVKPSELINKGAATVCTTVPPIARGLLELSNTQPELYPLTITLGDYPKAPENQPAFTIAPAESVPSRDNADLGTIVFAPAYPADMRTIRFCDLQKDRKNAPENAKTVDRDENEKWKWVDNFIRERDLPRPPPLGLRWRINRQIRDNDLCLSLEGPSRIVAIGNPEEPALYKGKFASQDGELPDALATYIANVLSAMQPERPLSARDATDVADKWINKNYNWLSPENKRIHVKDQLNYLKVLTFDDWLQGPIFLAALKACNQPELIEKKDYTPKPELQKEDNGNPFSLTYQKRVEDWETGTILEHVVAGFHDNLRTRCATLTASSDGEMTDDDKLVYFYAVANSLDYYLKAWDATKEELDRAPLTFTARVGVPGGDPENAETTGLIIDGDENH